MRSRRQPTSRLYGLPVVGTRGGAAIFWDRNRVNLHTHVVGVYSLTANVTVVSSTTNFWFTTVYGPTDDNKEEFLAELARVAPPAWQPWLINGDFNLIYEAREKKNSNIIHGIMRKFKPAIDAAGL